MRQGFTIYDADAHMEPMFDLWSQYIEPEYYDRRPRVSGFLNGHYTFFDPCELFPNGAGRESMGGGRAMHPPEVTARQREKYGESYDVAWSAESRLKDMDRYGWDKMVCLPGGTMPVGQINKDQALLWAVTRAWNNWAHDFCQADPSRLKMVPTMPRQHDIEGFFTETRRCVEELGAVTIQMPGPLPEGGKPWQDPSYDAFWNLAVDLDFPVAFHGASSAQPGASSRYSRETGALVALEHAITFPFENMIAMGHLIYTGILERFPKLRVSFLEGSAGWLPFWLGRLDDHAIEGRRLGVWFQAQRLPLKPSEYFLRQGFVACDGDEAALKGTILLVGDDNIVWNTDYPHPDAPDPARAAASLLDQPISDESKRKILKDNCVKLYGSRMLA